MKLWKHHISRNLISWDSGTHTLEIEYHGTKQELQEKLRKVLEEELGD